MEQRSQELQLALGTRACVRASSTSCCGTLHLATSLGVPPYAMGTGCEGPSESWRLRRQALSWGKEMLQRWQTEEVSDELRERAVRLVFESDRPIAQVARDLGIHKEALRQWVRQAEADQGSPARTADDERARGAEAAAKGDRRAEARERDLEGRLRLFRDGARPDPATVTRYVEERREAFGVEPICRVLGVPVSTHYARRSRKPSRRELVTANSSARSRPPAAATGASTAPARPGRSCAGAASAPAATRSRG